MVDSAKREREVAAKELNDAIRQADNYRVTPNPSSRILKQRIAKIEDKETTLRVSHYRYLEKAKIELNDDTEEAYLIELTDKAQDSIDNCSILIDEQDDDNVPAPTVPVIDPATIEQAEKEKSRKRIKREITVDESFAKNLVDQMNTLMTRDPIPDVVDSIATLKVHNQKLIETVENLNKSWKSYISVVESDDEEAEEDRINVKRMNYLDFQTKASKFIDKHKPVKEISDVESVISDSNRSVSSITNRNDLVRPERISNPVFSGDVRDYARFKKDFEKIVVTYHSDESHQVYIIKEKCLKGKAKSLIINLETMKDIWERLDDKYGDKIDLVDIVIKDLENLPQLKVNDDLKFVQMVDTLEKGLNDLQAIGARSQISNAYTVKLIELKISRQLYLTWLKEEETEDSRSDPASIDTLPKPSRFEMFFKFLTRERRRRMKLLNRVGESRQPPPPPPRRESANGANAENQQQKRQKCLIHTNATHFTRKCHAFKGKTTEERALIVKNTNGCHLCLSTDHIGQPCPYLETWGKCSHTGCNKYHSHLLHEADHKGLLMCLNSSSSSIVQPIPSSTISVNSISTSTQNSASAKHNNNVLLLIQNIKTEHDEISTFFDNGSTLSLVSKSYVQRNNLKGVRVSYELTTVGGKTTTEYTYLHNIVSLDSDNNRHIIEAFEIANICGHIANIDVSRVVNLFEGLIAVDVQRSSGNIELLVGMREINVHPTPLKSINGLMLYESRFGTNRILGGTHELLEVTDRLNRVAAIMAGAQVENVRVMFDVDLDSGIDFFTSEEFGVKVHPTCDNCRNCKVCTIDAHNMTRKEQKGLKAIENNLVLCPIEKRWTASYPFEVDPSILPNNEKQIDRLLIQTENRLLKSPEASAKYKEQFDDFVKRGVFELLSDDEMTNYDGPVFYVPHHEVYKEESSSTPVRIVINSSMKFDGLSLNDIMLKGPNVLNDLFGVQLRFRSYLIAVVCDISKLYHSINTTTKEKHLRRVKWRNLEQDKPMKTYGSNVVMPGDRPAAAISGVVMRKNATIHKEIHEEAAEKIKRDSYVDDIATGTEVEDAEAVESLKNGIEKILLQGGFKVKGFVTSGSESKEILSLLGTGELGRVLGIGYDPKDDVFRITVRLNFSKKLRKGRAQPDIEYENIASIMSMIITLRLLLSFVNSCYDALGLVAPITVQLKIPLRDLHCKVQQKILSWDDDIPEEMKSNWIEVIKRVKEVENVTFKRCVKPSNAIGNPNIVIFSDGSEQAMCAVAYVRWECSDGTIRCYLWAAKTRVTPIKKLTMPRVEMQAAVMAVRLGKSIKENSIWTFNKVYHVIDSMCTLATIRNDTSPLRQFMGNRVTEILETTTVQQWFHVKSEENIADLATRMDATATDIAEDSEWQNGKSWMLLPFSKWPVTQDTGKVDIPKDELKNAHICSHANIQLTSPIVYDKYIGRSYKFAIKLTAIVLRIARNKSFKGGGHITVKDMKQGELYVSQQSMKLTQQLLEEGKLDSLRPEKNQDNLIVLRSRATEGLRAHYDTNEFPILAYKDPIAYLWIKEVHDEDHGGSIKVAAKSRRKFWIIRASRLAQKVRRSCYDCRLKDKELAQQLMAPLPTSRLVMSPVFNEVSLDLFGPFEIRDTVKRRCKKKVWGLIIDCLATRAIHLDITEDYGSEAFLETLRKFISLRGSPSNIHCDKGSQLVAASDDVRAWSVEEGIDLIPAPAEGQIKSVKKTLSHTIGNNVFTFSRLQLVFYEAATIVNSRPIGIVSGSDPTCPDPITPNHLLLGRSTPKVATGPFTTTPNARKRLAFIEELITTWWNRWYQSVLPSLVPQYKWLTRHRNIQVGDVCLIRYKSELRATYRLGQVVEANPGVDGLVRKVTLKYKLPSEKTHRLVDRPIHGIAVIVPIEEQHNQSDLNIEHENITTSDLNPCASNFIPKNGTKASNPGMFS